MIASPLKLFLLKSHDPQKIVGHGIGRIDFAQGLQLATGFRNSPGAQVEFGQTRKGCRIAGCPFLEFTEHRLGLIGLTQLHIAVGQTERNPRILGLQRTNLGEHLESGRLGLRF